MCVNRNLSFFATSGAVKLGSLDLVYRPQQHLLVNETAQLQLMASQTVVKIFAYHETVKVH